MIRDQVTEKQQIISDRPREKRSGRGLASVHNETPSSNIMNLSLARTIIHHQPEPGRHLSCTIDIGHAIVYDILFLTMIVDLLYLLMLAKLSGSLLPIPHAKCSEGLQQEHN